MVFVMITEDVITYLGQSKVGVIATLRRDGSPHAVPRLASVRRGIDPRLDREAQGVGQ